MGLAKLLIIWGLTLMGAFHMYKMFAEQKSKMTWMYEKPRYHEIKVAESGLRNSYGLYFYGEGEYFKNEIAKGFRDSAAWPVLFVPGSGGSYKQCRSIGSVLYNKWKKAKESPYFHTFAIDLQEELTGIYGGPLDEQVKFVRKAIQELLEFYPADAKLTIVGHSMGGMVAKAVVKQFADRVNFILTLGSPHAYPVISDRILKKFTAEHWNEIINVPCYSVVGGFRDVQVRSALSFDAECTFVRGESVPGTWVSQDHQSLVWDNGLVLATARSIYDARKYTDKIDHILDYHWTEKTNTTHQYSELKFEDATELAEFPFSDSQLTVGNFELPIDKDGTLVIYGDTHRIELNGETSNAFMISDNVFFSQTSLSSDSSGLIQTSGEASYSIISEKNTLVVPYVISGLFKWIPGVSTKIMELNGGSIIDLEGLLMTYQVFDVSTDAESILILRENEKITIIKENEMTVSLTQATKESTAQLMVLPSLTGKNDVKLTLSVNIFAVFDILFREYWTVIGMSFIKISLTTKTLNTQFLLLSFKQPSWRRLSSEESRRLGFSGKYFFSSPSRIISVRFSQSATERLQSHGLSGLFQQSNKLFFLDRKCIKNACRSIKLLMILSDSKFAPDSEVLDSRSLFHPLVCIICFIFAGVFLETLAFCAYALLRLAALLLGRILDLFHMLFSVKLFILACSAVLLKINGATALIPIILASFFDLAYFGITNKIK
ncbi:unnamed protein product [Oikopleura dioica]|uniref:GPI inositol-deacylase n=1 Tax=Oikopleura dioica TaxID=34765 RepID=E4Y8Z0_OIKDI|nr:unnamed protein product [Oikopleura dioica]